MIMTPHILAGAALGSLMPGSVGGKMAAFFIGLTSHYLLDIVPHWERLFGPHYNDKLSKNFDDWPRHILVQGAVDAFLGLLLLRFFVLSAPTGLALGVFLGGIGGAIPDILDNTPFWAKWTKNIPFWRFIRSLHRFVHISITKQKQLPRYTGLLTQILAVTTASAVLLR